MDTTLFEYTINESYTYYDNGAIKRADNHYGIREYEYNSTGFPVKIIKYTRHNKVKSIVSFEYMENGLLQRETTTLANGDINEVLIYEYTFR